LLAGIVLLVFSTLLSTCDSNYPVAARPPQADVRNPGGLRPGAFARVDIVIKEADLAVTAPTRAIVTFAGLEKVWLVQEGRAVEKPITTGARIGEWTEVTEGVHAGELVIVDAGNLRADQPVRVAR
jgi:hypothetical protein